MIGEGVPGRSGTAWLQDGIRWFSGRYFIAAMSTTR